MPQLQFKIKQEQPPILFYPTPFVYDRHAGFTPDSEKAYNIGWPIRVDITDTKEGKTKKSIGNITFHDPSFFGACFDTPSILVMHPTNPYTSRSGDVVDITDDYYLIRSSFLIFWQRYWVIRKDSLWIESFTQHTIHK